MTQWDDPLAAAHDGHLLAAAAVALAVSVAAISAERTRRTMIAALVTVTLAVVVAPSSSGPVRPAAEGGPAAPGAPTPGTTPGGRLFSTTSSSRGEYWRVALIDFRDHPVAGSGAGTFVRQWYRHRRISAPVQDAHSLYLEKLAELGAIGLALLLCVLAIPVLAATRIRAKPFVAGAFGAYVAFAAHAAVDWDWELPAVTFAGIFCGAMLVVAARSERTPIVFDGGWRSPFLPPALALLALSFVGLVGNQAEATALSAASRGDWGEASEKARQTRTWAPWSTQALVVQADVALARGDAAAARSLLRRAVQADPHDYLLWRRLADETSGRGAPAGTRACGDAQSARLIGATPVVIDWSHGAVGWWPQRHEGEGSSGESGLDTGRTPCRWSSAWRPWLFVALASTGTLPWLSLTPAGATQYCTQYQLPVPAVPVQQLRAATRASPDRLRQQPRRCEQHRDLRHEHRRLEADPVVGEHERVRRTSILVAGRAEARLRQQPGRELPGLRDERRRQRPDAADDCRRRESSSRLVAGRDEDRLRQHPRRQQRRGLRDERRRQRPDAADEQPRDRRQRRLVAGQHAASPSPAIETATSRST